MQTNTHMSSVQIKVVYIYSKAKYVFPAGVNGGMRKGKNNRDDRRIRVTDYISI